jgi:hypothetical protein
MTAVPMGHCKILGKFQVFDSAFEFVVVAVTSGSVASESDFSPILEVLGMSLRFHFVLHLAQLQFTELLF